jgi:hypothetical protein
VHVWRNCYGQSNTFPSNIQLPYVDHYFRYVFGEWSIVMLLQGSSFNVWVFLNNLKVNLPLNIQKHCVATLALGPRPRQGLVKVWAKSELGSHISCFQECKRVWGNETPHPKWTPILGVEVPMDSQIFRGPFQGSKLIRLKNSLYH